VGYPRSQVSPGPQDQSGLPLTNIRTTTWGEHLLTTHSGETERVQYRSDLHRVHGRGGQHAGITLFSAVVSPDHTVPIVPGRDCFYRPGRGPE